MSDPAPGYDPPAAETIATEGNPADTGAIVSTD